jgi:GrpB-like predicted nucleotidyltransferase (UPF0157 family)
MSRSHVEDEIWEGLTADDHARAAEGRWAALVASGEVEMFAEPTGEPVRLDEADPGWPARYEEVRARLAEALGATAVRIDHVGSTAVPGLAAKPVIDIQVSVPDVEDEAAYRPVIEGLRFPMRSREPGHRYFRTPPRTVHRIHIHVCQAGSDWERDHLLFRDYLRAHPAVTSRYAEVKHTLVERYRDDRLGYTEGKTPFIRNAVREAEEWARQTGWSVNEGWPALPRGA